MHLFKSVAYQCYILKLVHHQGWWRLLLLLLLLPQISIVICISLFLMDIPHSFLPYTILYFIGATPNVMQPFA
jgi:hypothetical protein